MGVGVDIKIDQVMQTDLVVVLPGIDIATVAKLMESENVGSILVADENKRLLGIITDRQIATQVVAYDLNPKSVQVNEVMTENPIVIFPETTCKEALDIIGDYGYRRLPVVKNERLVGLVSLSDLAPVVELDEECIADMVNELSSSVRYK